MSVSYLTATDLSPPAVGYVVGVQGAGSGVGLHELTPEVVRFGILAQSVLAGAHVGCWVNVGITAGDQRILQQVAATYSNDKVKN